MDFEEYNEFGGSKVLREAILRGKRVFLGVLGTFHIDRPYLNAF